MLNKKLLTAGFVAIGAYLIYRKYNDFSAENYIMEVDNGFIGSATGFLQTSFDSAISYGQEDLGMNFSVQLLDYLKLWESTKRNAKNEHIVYKDEAGYLTIGYGHKLVSGDGFNDKSTISEVEAVGLLLNDIESKAQRYVKKYVNIPLSQNQFDALVSFTFNAGQDAMRRLSSSVNSGNADVIPRLKTWNKIRKNGVLVESAGLVNRRAGDARIWDSGIYRK